MWDILGVIIAALALCYTVYYVRRLSKTLDILEDPEKLNAVIGDVVPSLVNTFKMSLMGKQSGYVQRKTKMQGLMQDFIIEEIAPDVAEGLIPGLPPIVGKWLATKVNDSELGDYLRDHPEMFPDALNMAGNLVSQFMEGQAARSLAKPANESSQPGWD